MKAIRMQNLRSLADTGFIELKPITLLLGQNSSGKSTFLRTFPLLRQSVETRTSGPILWFGRLVDFGDFQTAVGKYGESEEITLGFQFEYPFSPRNIYGPNVFRYRTTQFNSLVTLMLKLSKNDKNMTYVSECKVDLFEYTIKIGIDSNGKFSELKINNTNLLQSEDNFYPSSVTKIIPGFSYEGDIYERLFERSPIPLTFETSRGYRIRELIENIAIETSENMLQTVKKLSNLSDSQNKDDDGLKRMFGDVTQEWKKITSAWNINTEEFQLFRDLIIGLNIYRLLENFDGYIIKYIKNTHYITPTRATAERYYRIQDLAVDEVDADGKNLALFLWSLGEKKRQDFATWTEKVLGFTVSVQVEGGHISLMLREINSEAEFNVTDMGFGFSQILPIVTQLWVSFNPKKPSRISLPITFAIEQPELHLHPTLQAKLADAFLAAIQQAKKRGIDLRLIIETHSEVIVSRLGHRVAHQEITPEEINVVLFDKKDTHSPTEIRIAQYDEQGYLTNWPFGFFEPDRI